MIRDFLQFDSDWSSCKRSDLLWTTISWFHSTWQLTLLMCWSISKSWHGIGDTICIKLYILMIIMELISLKSLDTRDSVTISTLWTHRIFFIWRSNIFCRKFEKLQNTSIFNFSLPDSFNYSRSIKQRDMIKEFQARPKDPNDDYPMMISEYHSGFFSVFRMISVYSKLGDRFLVPNHHKSYVNQGVKYLIHSPYDLFSKSSISYQSVPNNSLIIYLNPQKTQIDDALKNFQPKRSEYNFKGILNIRIFRIQFDNFWCWRVSHSLSKNYFIT